MIFTSEVIYEVTLNKKTWTATFMGILFVRYFLWREKEKLVKFFLHFLKATRRRLCSNVFFFIVEE